MKISNKSQKKDQIFTRNNVEKIKVFSSDLLLILLEKITEKELILKIQTSKLNKVSISTCIMVKNEEMNIKRCIESILMISNEIIVVDTGSSDTTIDRIREIDTSKIKVYHYQWEDDFSDVRNYAISKAVHDYVFFIDADELLILEEANKLTEFIKIINLIPETYKMGFSLKIKQHDDNLNADTVKIFKNDINFNFYGYCHEKLRYKEGNAEVIITNLTLVHNGYNTIDKVRLKKNRNTSLLLKMIDKDKADNRWIYFLTRDGAEILNSQYLENLIATQILKCPGNGFIESNMLVGEYTYGLLINLLQLLMNRNAYEQMPPIFTILNLKYPNNNDVIYFETIKKYMEKADPYLILKNLILNRKKNIDNDFSIIHTEGYHLDLLIGVLLFEVGEFTKSAKYIEFLVEKKYVSPILDYLSSHFKKEQ